MRLDLAPHPDSERGAVSAVHVDVSRPRDDALALRYVLNGNTAALRIPAHVGPERAEELWKHTCFEAFLQRPGEDRYYEFNLSPSTQWAAYAFDGYRRGMRAPAIPTPRITTPSVDATLLILETWIEPPGLAEGAWRLALSAVVEEIEGRKSYWALQHPPGKPDFHHPDCFAAELGPSEAP